MNKTGFKNFSLNMIILIIIFFADRLSKIYILKIVELENSVDIYITSYLNLYLIWNKGIAFGLLSINENIIYSIITCLIGIIILIILLTMWKNDNIQRYFLALIAGGALGNLYDRIVYTAVPDFIDFHFYGFHWFVFNVADIFITVGVVCLILDEVFFNSIRNDKNV
ncbi:signal peptidase II [Candidatus Pelagibacter sp. Uisw_134_02]|jgi:signal peptidase II|uniref:signal peptidase II n=1 Tax=Candidatus Pelagibacter sp. Uisw_134_02 TaxID=3230990 RepID=UPI0039ED8789|tara:strand:+ start:258 stop:758 length:501 start_codon:yes stop_codon:yes gene_type:complete